jgi:hypothetical protein
MMVEVRICEEGKVGSMNHQKIRLFAPALTLAVLLSACGGEPAAASPIETTSLPQGASVAPLVTLTPQDGAVSTQAPADADTPVQTQAPVTDADALRRCCARRNGGRFLF